MGQVSPMADMRGCSCENYFAGGAALISPLAGEISDFNGLSCMLPRRKNRQLRNQREIYSRRCGLWFIASLKRLQLRREGVAFNQAE
jgi:phosphoenolpyruvate carboxylase